MTSAASHNDRPTTTDEGTAVPSEDTQDVEGTTPDTELYEAAQENLEAAADPQGDSGEPRDLDPSTAPGDQPSATGDDEADSESETDDKTQNEDNPLDVEGEIAADYLEELLDIADLDGDIDTYVESDRAHVSILTDADVLVGSDGTVLEALQELSRLAVMTETGRRSRLMLDVAGYRDRRRRVLADLASDAVQEVQTSGDSVRLSPMNPFERKIVHDTVAAAGLSSESEGEEPARRVVVLPAR